MVFTVVLADLEMVALARTADLAAAVVAVLVRILPFSHPVGIAVVKVVLVLFFLC